MSTFSSSPLALALEQKPGLGCGQSSALSDASRARKKLFSVELYN
jgi:hypothetical protein